MTNLSDIQLILLTGASQREDGSLLPPPETLGALNQRIRKAMKALLKHELAEEAQVADAARAWREDGDRRIGLIITDKGRNAIGVQPPVQPAAAEAPAPTPPSEQTKSALVLQLLKREQGATLNELTEATGWLPHTTRAALTGLRKKGHAVEKEKRDDVTCYHVRKAASA